MLRYLAKGVVGEQHRLSAIGAAVVAELVCRPGAEYQPAQRAGGGLPCDFQRKTVAARLLNLAPRRIRSQRLDGDEALFRKQALGELGDGVVSVPCHGRFPILIRRAKDARCNATIYARTRRISRGFVARGGRLSAAISDSARSASTVLKMPTTCPWCATTAEPSLRLAMTPATRANEDAGSVTKTSCDIASSTVAS